MVSDYGERRKAAQRKYNPTKQKLRREKIGILGCYKQLVGCADCGYRQHATMLEFDHRDRATKSFTISSQGRGRKWATVWEEVRKCDVVCKACHMKRTHK